MTRVRDLGIESQAPILAGVAPFRSARAARYMRDRIAGMEVPEPLVRRMEAAGPAPEKAEAEGIRICVEIIEEVRGIPGVAGIHLMPIRWEEAVAVIAARAGLRPARAAMTRGTVAPGLAASAGAAVTLKEPRR
jgi:methylenetetrahydrofolate reductase (NADPH)